MRVTKNWGLAPRAAMLGRSLSALLIAIVGLTLVPTTAVAGALGLTSDASPAWGNNYRLTYNYSGSVTPLGGLRSKTTDILGRSGTSMFYCFEYAGPASTWVRSDSDFRWTLTSMGRDPYTVARLSWIVANGYTNIPGTGADPYAIGNRVGASINGIPQESANQLLAAATQAAIWRISDGKVLNAVYSNGVTHSQFTGYVRAVSNSLLVDSALGAAANPIGVLDVPPTSVGINPGSFDGESGQLLGPYTISTDGPSATVAYNDFFTGAYLSDASGNWIPNGTSVTNGQKVYVKTPAGSGGGNGTLTVTGRPGLKATAWVNGNEQKGGSVVLVPAKVVTAKASWMKLQSLKTTATDAADGDKVIAADGGTVKDVVEYTNLSGGLFGASYVIKGELYDKATGQPTGIKGQTTVTVPMWQTKSGSAVVNFVVPAGYAGKTLVAFEELYDASGRLIGRHKDINDAAQTVTVDRKLSLSTSATDAADGDQSLAWDGGKVKDTVSYTGLTPGTSYLLKGELMDKSTGLGTGITASKLITPSAANGSVDLLFSVPKGYAGKSLVAFERLYTADGTTLLASHTDLNDGKQTVVVAPEPITISTSATDQADGDRVLAAAGGTVVDQVSYTGLTPGRTYVLKGELMDKGTGTPTGVVGSKTFTPTASSGSTSLTFAVGASFAGKTLVVFETLYAADGSTVLADHKDLNDAAQTVVVEQPKPPVSISTSATDAADGDQELPWTGGTVNDVVTYSGLTPGATYVIKGELIDKSTGLGTGIVASKTFTPSAADGSVTVPFVVGTGFANKMLVVFETLYAADGSTVLAEHKDLADPDQTVFVKPRS